MTDSSPPRVCPGKQFSHDSLFALMSAILACFSIAPAKDDNGDLVPLKWEFEEGLLMCVVSSNLRMLRDLKFSIVEPSHRHLKPFRCAFTPRSDVHKQRSTTDGL